MLGSPVARNGGQPMANSPQEMRSRILPVTSQGIIRDPASAETIAAPRETRKQRSQLSHTQITDLKKHPIVSGCCSKPLCAGIICYTAMMTHTNVFPSGNVRTQARSSCRTSG